MHGVHRCLQQRRICQSHRPLGRQAPRSVRPGTTSPSQHASHQPAHANQHPKHPTITHSLPSTCRLLCTYWSHHITRHPQSRQQLETSCLVAACPGRINRCWEPPARPRHTPQHPQTARGAISKHGPLFQRMAQATATAPHAALGRCARQQEHS